MAQYIDKDALVAEIENLGNTYKECPIRNSYEEGLKDGRLIGYKDVLHKINTLEVKEVDLENELNEYGLYYDYVSLDRKEMKVSQNTSLNLDLKHRKNKVMTPDEKALVLKELCARLPYGIYVEMYSFSEKISVKLESIDVSDDDCLIINETWWLKDEYPKPIFRPMSSMTEEEERELTEINCQGTLAEHKYAIFYRSQDWLNKKMFDYRGLIEKGLALEASDGMYNIN